MVGLEGEWAELCEARMRVVKLRRGRNNVVLAVIGEGPCRRCGQRLFRGVAVDLMKNLGILLSGRGSNFEAIAMNVASGKIPEARIPASISNRATAGGLESPQ